MENQYTISTIETKLIPRQRPQIPPKLAKKSNQVILAILSNSVKGKMFSLVSVLKKIMFQPNAVVSAKNKLSTAMSRSYALYSGSI